MNRFENFTKLRRRTSTLQKRLHYVARLIFLFIFVFVSIVNFTPRSVNAAPLSTGTGNGTYHFGAPFGPVSNGFKKQGDKFLVNSYMVQDGTSLYTDYDIYNPPGNVGEFIIKAEGTTWKTFTFQDLGITPLIYSYGDEYFFTKLELWVNGVKEKSFNDAINPKEFRNSTGLKDLLNEETLFNYQNVTEVKVVWHLKDINNHSVHPSYLNFDTITIADVSNTVVPANHAPTDIALNNSSVNQSGGANAVVGALTTTDPDAGDTHTYSLVTGTGDTNNASFNIDGSNLRVNDVSSLTAGTYSVRIRSTDSGSTPMSFEKVFTITVVGSPPTVNSVTVPSNGSYREGDHLIFTVNFSKNVNVTGTPSLSIDVGGQTREALYISGTGTSSAVFRYIVVAGDNDDNGITVSSLGLNGATILDSTGNNANLTLNSVGSTTGVLVDTTAPTVTSVSVPSNGTYIAGQNLDFTVNFSEIVTVSNSPTLVLDIGGQARTATYQSGSGSSSLVFRYTVTPGENDSDGISVAQLQLGGAIIRDLAGNDAILILNGVGPTNGVLVDTVQPSITSVNVPSNGTYTTGQNLDFSVNYDKAITITGTPQLAVNIGGQTRYATYLSGSGTSSIVFRYTVANGDSDNDGITLPGSIQLNGGTIRSASGNNATLTLNNVDSTTSVLVDALAPTITSVNVPANGVYKEGQNLDFTVNFSESVTIDILGGTPYLSIGIGSQTRQATYVSGSGSSGIVFRYTVQAGDNDVDGIAVSSLDLNGGLIQDSVGNNGTLTLNSVGSTTSVLVDTTAPTVASVTVPANGTYIAGQHLNFTVNFSENIVISGTPRIALDIGGQTRYATYQSGSGSSAILFRYTAVAGDYDDNGIAVTVLQLNSGTVQDAAGNNANLTLNSVGATNSVLVDAVQPTIASVSVPGNGTYKAGEHLEFTVNFSENVIISGTPRLVLNIGGQTRYATYTSGSGTSTIALRYTVVNGDYDNNGIELIEMELNSGAVEDGVGNNALLTLNNVEVTTSVNVDAVDPTVVSVYVPSNGSYREGQYLDFTVNFSKDVTITGTPRLVLDIGGQTNYAIYQTGTGTTAEFRYTVADGANDNDGISITSLDLNGGTIQDSVGNTANVALNNIGSTSSVLVDTTLPIINTVSVPSNGTYIAGQNLDFTLNFSEVIVITGTPRIVLDIGGQTRYATYQSGSGSSAILFRYTAVAGDYDDNGIAVTVLQLNSGTVQDAAGNNANLTLNSVGGTNSVLVDAVQPTIGSVSVPANGTYKADDNLEFTVNFSENVMISGTPRLVLEIGDQTRYANYQSGNGTTAVVFRYTVVIGDNDDNGISISGVELNSGTIQDSIGNPAILTLNGVGSTTEILTDTMNPTVVSVIVPNNGNYKVNQHLEFTLNFSENVVVTGTPRLVLDIGGETRYATYQSGNNSSVLVFRYTVSLGDIDNDGITINELQLNGGTIQDGVGHPAILILNNVASTTEIKVIQNSTLVPTSESFDKNIDNQLDVSVNMALNGNTLSSITNGNVELTSVTDYTVAGNTVTIKKEYLATQAIGTTTLTFMFSAGDAQNLAITIIDTTPTYTVFYDGNGSTGGTVPTDSNHYQQQANITVLGNTGNLVKTGYTFAGWNTQADGSGTNYTSGDIFQIGNSHVTLFAKWNVNASTDGGGGGGGGSSTPSTPGTETITVIVESGNRGTTVSETTIERTTDPNGRVKDAVTLTEKSVTETIEKLLEQRDTTARIVIPDTNDKVSQVDVQIPKDAAKKLGDANVNLEIKTPNVIIQVPQSSLDGFDEDLYFRVTPLKEQGQKDQVRERAETEEKVKELSQGMTITVLGRPMTIETNMQSRPVTLTLPASGLDLPTNVADREKFLANLVIFIEHSDGEKALIKPTLVQLENGEYGLQFGVNKFSTFTILEIEGLADSFHAKYISGYPDGTFKPSNTVTRAEIAAMIARNLGYDDSKSSQGPFSDVPSAHWGAGVIEFVKQQGLMKGDNAGKFNPNAAITRAEMAAIVARYKELSLPIDATKAFPDITGHWAAKEIAANKQAGIISGYQDGTFRPNGSLTRAEAVKVMNGMFDRGPLYGVTKPTFKDVPATHWAFHEVEEAAQDHFFTPRDAGGENLVK